MTPGAVGGGPVFSLRLWGLVCPCLESSENKSARQSLNQLNAIGSRSVDWFSVPQKPTSTTAAVADAASAAFRGLFGRSTSNVSSSGGGSGVGGSDAVHDPNDKPPTRAHLRLVDATKAEINYGAPYPQLELKPLPQEEQYNSNQQQEDDGGGDGLMKTSSGQSNRNNAMSYQLDIPLHHIIRIRPVDNSDNLLSIVTKDVHHGVDDNAQKEACRIGFQTSTDRDTACLDLQVLVEWNRQRVGPDGIEEDLPAAGIRQRAQKAAHFARREIEMREKKRDREKRKAGHMQGTTGLKYTAMAMASNNQ